MFEFFSRLFGREPSSATAKERLRLVLLSDHLALAPDVIDALKSDLVDVISRYVEVDTANCDVTFEQREKQVAMLANIPILGMRPRPPRPSQPDPYILPPPTPYAVPPTAYAAPQTEYAVLADATAEAAAPPPPECSEPALAAPAAALVARAPEQASASETVPAEASGPNERAEANEPVAALDQALTTVAQEPAPASADTAAPPRTPRRKTTRRRRKTVAAAAQPT